MSTLLNSAGYSMVTLTAAAVAIEAKDVVVI